MTVVFRADASGQMGTGHVTRCATLADAMRARGAQVSFVCREHPGHLAASLQKRDLPVTLLPAPPRLGSGASEDYAAWLGVSEREDSEQTIAAIGDRHPDWLVVDHYALGIEWEQRLRRHVGRLMVVDDLANRCHDCDLLLDQNYSRKGGGRYESLVPEQCERLIGPRYALLAPEYATYRQAQPARERGARRVLVYFGGADPANMTGQALAALSAPEFSHLVVDVVIGASSSHGEAIEALAAGRCRTQLHATRPHLADLMVHADLAIGAGGTTAWERMCLGVPSLVVSIAENQRATCEALAAGDFIEYVGDVRSVGAPQIRASLKRLIEDQKRLAQLSSRGTWLVDGHGASRVADTALGRPGADLIRRRNALHEANACPEGFDTFSFLWIDRCRASDVLALRNMPHVTAQMKSRDPITEVDHRLFLDGYDQLDRYDFVLVDDSDGRYVGGFYVTNIESSPQIGKYIGDPAYLGKGIAQKAMRRLLDFCRSRAGLHRLVSITRHDNVRNIALNTRLGFIQSSRQGDYVVMTADL